MKYSIFLIFFIQSIFVFAAPADCTFDPSGNLAGTLEDCASGTLGVDPSDGPDDAEDSIKERVVNIAEATITFGALLAVGGLVWAGIQYTKAYGDDEKLKKSKTTIIYTLIGLVLLMGSFGLVDIFINFVYTMAGSA